MSGFSYTYRGNDNTTNGFGPRTTDWRRTDYGSDHVCRPVIVDAEGRKHPIVSFTPNHNTEAYITQTETIVEHVRAPVTEYGYSEVVPVRNYGYGEDKWRKPLSPVRDRPHSHSQHSTHSPFDAYNHSSPTEGFVPKWHNRPSSPTKVVPVKDYGYGENKWHNKPSSPDRERVKDYGYGENKWHSKPSSPDRERPSKVDQFSTKVQTEASRPNRFGPLSANFWRRSPDSNKGRHGNSNDYGDYSDLSSKERYKPSVNTIGNDNYDDYYRRNDSPIEPKMITTGGWNRPNRSVWSSPPDSNLSKPTNDIGTAMEMLKEAAKPTPVTTSPQSRFTVPLTTGPKRDSYPQTIDSKEATRRYSNFNLTSRPSEQYTGTIDSRQAVSKYNGAIV